MTWCHVDLLLCYFLISILFLFIPAPILTLLLFSFFCKFNLFSLLFFFHPFPIYFFYFIFFICQDGLCALRVFCCPTLFSPQWELWSVSKWVIKLQIWQMKRRNRSCFNFKWMISIEITPTINSDMSGWFKFRFRKDKHLCRIVIPLRSVVVI